MRNITHNTLLALGFDTDLIAKIAQNNHTLSVLKAMSDKALLATYAPAEAQLIKDRIKRKPIDDDVLERVINAAYEACCFCEDGNSERPYQIHHIVEHAKTQDNSEDNLLLICPSHHQSVPKHFSEDEQKARRRAWHATVLIAKAYRNRGISYPYGLFAAKDYGRKPRPEELIEGYRLSPSTALAVSRHALAQEGLEQVTSRHFLLIVGASGDGKTTLAVGVAGLLSESGLAVYSYQRPHTGNSPPLKDILTFLEAADRACVLLLDDANLYLTETDLSQIAASAGKPVLVIATWTRGSLSDTVRLERHLLNSLLVSWERVREGIRQFLLAHETVVVQALQKLTPTGGAGRTVGLGYMNIPLVSQIARYEKGAKTAAGFFFLLRGGGEIAKTEIESLANDSRSDVPVLFAAVEQIAGFERLVTPGEAAEACQRVETTARQGATPEWVQEVFETQRGRGHMQEERGGYTTIHRDWAAHFIEAGHANEGTRPELERLLAPNLDVGATEPKRLLRAWSWLCYEKSAGAFVRSRLASATPADWASLVGRAIADGLGTIGPIADRMHILFRRPDWEQTVAKAFSAHESSLRALLEHVLPSDLYSLRSLAMALDHAAPDLAARVWESWPPAKAASLIEQLHPDDYDTANWLLNSVGQHSPVWVMEVGKSVQWTSISERLKEVSTGDLDSVFRVRDLMYKLGKPTYRSMIRRLADASCDALARAHLADIHVGFAHMFWWISFPDDVARIIQALDLPQLTEDLVSSRPREWRHLAEFAAFLGPVGNEFLATLLQTVDTDAFVNCIRSQSEGYEYELRCLIWVLRHASDERKIELAEKLYGVIRDACNRSKTELPQIMRAYRALDEMMADKLAAELAFDNAQPEEDDKEPEDDPGDSEIAKIRKRYAELDASGEDYIVDDPNAPPEKQVS